MIRMFPIKSGSCGNVTFLGTYEYGFLLDAGVKHGLVKRLLRKHRFLDIPKKILISHPHQDHDEFADEYTIFGSVHRLDEDTNIEGVNVIKCPHGSISSFGAEITFPHNERVLWLTDLESIPYEQLNHDFYDYVLIECNNNLDDWEKKQGMERHLTAEKVIEFIHKVNFNKIHFLHLSSRIDFDAMMKKVSYHLHTTQSFSYFSPVVINSSRVYEVGMVDRKAEAKELVKDYERKSISK